MIQFTKPLYLILLMPLAYYVWRLSAASLTDMSRSRSRLALVLRFVILTALVFTLAGARMVRNASEQCVIFALDVSDSLPKAKQDAALQYVNAALKTMKSHHKAGLVVFGSEASIELAPANMKKVDKIYSVPNTGNTDISQALGVALAMFPENSAKKIVLLSDGNETWGKAIEQAALAGANNVSIDVIPVVNELPHEALLDKMICPNNVKVGEPFDLKLVTESKEPTTAIVRILRNGVSTVTKEVELAKGKNALTFQQSIAAPGNYEFKAILECPQDTLVENNQALGYTMVRGKPRALYVEGQSGQETYLTKALKSSDIDVETRNRSGIPNTLAQLRAYDMVIFSDVPAWSLAPEQMTLIKSGVKDLGIGFTMIGGENSFGAGGYFATPIEETLPVNMSIRKTKVMPSLSVVIVMDKSGSMGMIQDGKEKIQLANDAAAAVVDLLQPIDKAGVIVCHSWPVVAVPLQFAKNKNSIYREISTIRAEGGGIAVFPSMKFAYDMISSAKTRQKHIILLADGADCDEQDGVVPLVRKMANEKITVTAVAIGDGPHVPFLKDVARAGGGDFYLTLRARDLKAIFTKDVMKISKSLVIEEPFIPRMDPSCPELSGIGPSAPPLLGYVATSPKPAATVAMESHRKDPILATWQYGLGKSAAFTSDCKARWSTRWLTWSDYSKFWAQVVRSTMRKSSSNDFQTTVDIESGRGRVTIDAVDDKGNFLNFLKFSGSVIGPDFKAREVAIEQTGPGRYEAAFDANDVGSYLVNVVRKDKNQTAAESNIVSIAYPAEYKDISPNTALLERIAQETSGKFDPKASDVFSGSFRESRVYTDLWRFLTLIAAILLPLDVAVRRVIMSPHQIIALCRRIWESLSRRLRRQKKERTEDAETAETTGALLRRKQDRRAALTMEDLPKRIETAQPPKPSAEKPAEPAQPTGESDAGTTSKLLEAKRRAREKAE